MHSYKSVHLRATSTKEYCDEFLIKVWNFELSMVHGPFVGTSISIDNFDHLIKLGIVSWFG